MIPFGRTLRCWRQFFLSNFALGRHRLGFNFVVYVKPVAALSVLQRSRRSWWIIIPRDTFVIIIVIVVVIIIIIIIIINNNIIIITTGTNTTIIVSIIIIIIFFFFFFFFFCVFIINIINIIIIITTLSLQVSLPSVSQFAVRLLKELSAFHQWGSIENSAQYLFYSFQNKSVFVKGARIESSWQDWHIKVNCVFGSKTDPLSSLLYPVFPLLPPTIPLPPRPLHPLLNNRYRKIPKICPGAYIFQRPLLRGLSTEFYGSLRI